MPRPRQAPQRPHQRDLDCEQTKLTNPNGRALSADGLIVKGACPCEAQVSGEVRLLGADIGGPLACNQARLTNPNGWR